MTTPELTLRPTVITMPSPRSKSTELAGCMGPASVVVCPVSPLASVGKDTNRPSPTYCSAKPSHGVATESEPSGEVDDVEAGAAVPSPLHRRPHPMDINARRAARGIVRTATARTRRASFRFVPGLESHPRTSACIPTRACGGGSSKRTLRNFAAFVSEIWNTSAPIDASVGSRVRATRCEFDSRHRTGRKVGSGPEGSTRLRLSARPTGALRTGSHLWRTTGSSTKSRMTVSSRTRESRKIFRLLVPTTCTKRHGANPPIKRRSSVAAVAEHVTGPLQRRSWTIDWCVSQQSGARTLRQSRPTEVWIQRTVGKVQSDSVVVRGEPAKSFVVVEGRTCVVESTWRR
jgi:hypothetical protein